MPAPSRRQRRRAYHRSGLHTLKKTVAALEAPALLSPATPLGQALAEWREALVADLGGEAAVTTQQRALVDLAVRTKLLVDSVDAYVLGMPSPVDRRHRRLWAVVRERQSLVAQLQSILRDLGLERRTKPTLDLGHYLAEQRTPSAPPPGEGSQCLRRGVVSPTTGNIGNGGEATPDTVSDVPTSASGEAVE